MIQPTTYSEVQEFLKTVSYKPGWTFEAERFTSERTIIHVRVDMRFDDQRLTHHRHVSVLHEKDTRLAELLLRSIHIMENQLAHRCFRIDGEPIFEDGFDE